jgi:hypothetical protein
VVVAAFSAWHERQEDAAAALTSVTGLPAYAMLEVYSVLTRRPGGYAVPAATAAGVLETRFSDPPLRLGARERRRLLATLATAGVFGGATYDALVALEAQAHGRALLSLDGRSGHVPSVGSRVPGDLGLVGLVAIAACAHGGHDSPGLGTPAACLGTREHITNRRVLGDRLHRLARRERGYEAPQHQPIPDSAAAPANPSTVMRPDTSPPLRTASGIIESINMTSSAPAAKPSIAALKLPETLSASM